MEIRINAESWNDSLKKNVEQLGAWEYMGLAQCVENFRAQLFNYHHCYTSYMKESYKHEMIKVYGDYRILVDKAIVLGLEQFVYCHHIATFMEMIVANV